MNTTIYTDEMRSVAWQIAFIYFHFSFLLSYCATYLYSIHMYVRVFLICSRLFFFLVEKKIEIKYIPSHSPNSIHPAATKELKSFSRSIQNICDLIDSRKQLEQHFFRQKKKQIISPAELMKYMVLFQHRAPHGLKLIIGFVESFLLLVQNIFSRTRQFCLNLWNVCS